MLRNGFFAALRMTKGVQKTGRGLRRMTEGKWRGGMISVPNAIPSLFLVLYVAGAAAARAARLRRVGGTVGRAVGFAGLLHGAFDPQPLHVLVGRDFGVDGMALDHQGQRHAQYEKPHGSRCAKYDDRPRWHNIGFLAAEILAFADKCIHLSDKLQNRVRAEPTGFGRA